jgi:hypothetical protein
MVLPKNCQSTWGQSAGLQERFEINLPPRDHATMIFYAEVA